MNHFALDRLPVDWAAWTLENLIRGVQADEITKVLQSSGFQEIAEELQLSNESSSLVAKDAVRALTTFREILLRRLRLRMAKGAAVERARIDPERFYRDYYFNNEPVVMLDLCPTDSALSHWTPDNLKCVCGETLVEVQQGRDADPDYEANLDHHRTRMEFGTFVDLVLKNGKSNDIYMCANNRTLNSSLSDLLPEVPNLDGYLNPQELRAKCHLWFGPEGTVTPFHYDLMNVLLLQVYGEKSYILAPPEATPLMYNYRGVFSRVDAFGDHSQYPLFEKVPVSSGILRRGEALFIPAGWWHAIRAESVSISLSFTNFTRSNDFRMVSG